MLRREEPVTCLGYPLQLTHRVAGAASNTTPGLCQEKAAPKEAGKEEAEPDLEAQ